MAHPKPLCNRAPYHKRLELFLFDLIDADPHSLAELARLCNLEYQNLYQVVKGSRRMSRSTMNGLLEYYKVEFNVPNTAQSGVTLLPKPNLPPPVLSAQNLAKTKTYQSKVERINANYQASGKPPRPIKTLAPQSADELAAVMRSVKHYGRTDIPQIQEDARATLESSTTPGVPTPAQPALVTVTCQNCNEALYQSEWIKGKCPSCGDLLKIPKFEGD